MSIINQKTGFYGFTLDGTVGSITIDNNGRVNRCIFSILYPYQTNDVEFTMSTDGDDWGALMGDGTIIPLTNPVILFVNRDNTILQFDMDEVYPANSPCFLVYRSDTAWYNVKAREVARPFTVNSVSGMFAFTVEGYGGTTDENGQVNRILATIPFPNQVGEVEFSISDDPSHWGAHMGNGEIIELYDPVLLYTNSENAIVQFSMKTPYPSNSPCVLVYRSEEARYNIHVIADDDTFIPVQDLTNLPIEVKSGMLLDLTTVETFPSNASRKGIEWTVQNGNAAINDNNILQATGEQTLYLLATIPGGLGDDNDFRKYIQINVVSNRVDVYTDPQSEVYATQGNITEKIFVTAESDSGEISYQWYRSRTNNTVGGTKMDGETNPYLYLPTDLTAGDYYFFCTVSSVGATSVNSRICHVLVEVPMEGISITPTNKTLELTQQRQLTFNIIPSEVTYPTIVWESTDSNVISIDDTGMITGLSAGTSTIIGRTVDGQYESSLTITVQGFTPVTNILGIIAEAENETSYKLTPTVVPSTASNQTIIWRVVDIDDDIEAGSTIADGVFRAEYTGIAVIRAIIEHGVSPVQDYVQDFSIHVVQRHISVDDVDLTGTSDSTTSNSSGSSKARAKARATTTSSTLSHVYVGEKNILSADISPLNSSGRNATFEIQSAGTTGASIKDGNELTVTAAGSLIIRVSVENGNSDGTTFYKDFTVTAYPGRVAVESADFTISEWDPHAINGRATELKVEITPADATEQDYQITLLDAGPAKISFNSDTNEIYSEHYQEMTYDMTDATALFEIRIPDGISSGVDFVTQTQILITPPVEPDIFVPVTEITLNLPTPMRGLYPVLLGANHDATDSEEGDAEEEEDNSYEVVPWNAHEKNVQFEQERVLEEGGLNAILYNPNEYELQSPVLSEFFDWKKDDTYLFPWCAGKINLHATIVNGDTTDHDDQYCTDTIDFNQTFELEFDEPYIPVKEVVNIPTSIPIGRSIVLTGELGTKGGLNFYNPFWDEDTPTYTNLQWRMGSDYIDQTRYPNTAGAELLDGNVIRAARAGRFTIQAYVENGTAEPIQWYGKEQIGEPYTQLFTFTVSEEETPYDEPIVTLTLVDTSTVEVYRDSDMTQLCSDLPEDTTITIGGRQFKKNQVVEVKFYEASEEETDTEQPGQEGSDTDSTTGDSSEGTSSENTEETDLGDEGLSEAEGGQIPETPAVEKNLPVITSLRNFGRNFTKLTKINAIPDTVTGDNCLRFFLRGCTSFNQDITVPENVKGNYCLYGFLMDCTSFNSTVTFAGEVSGTNYCMAFFLYGCTAYNKPITIPPTVQGLYALYKALAKCENFNSRVTLPQFLNGESCLREFLAECHNYNQPIRLPDDLKNYGYELNSFMRGCYKMCSQIYVPADTGAHANVSEQTLSTMVSTSDMITQGVTLVGPGASDLIDKMDNFPVGEGLVPPYRNLILGDTSEVAADASSYSGR